MFEVFKRLSHTEDLVCQPILGRYDSNIGSVLSPHDATVSLMKVVKLRKKEGSSLLLLRYPVL